jgi:hypothetical protein
MQKSSVLAVVAEVAHLAIRLGMLDSSRPTKREYGTAEEEMASGALINHQHTLSTTRGNELVISMR